MAFFCNDTHQVRIRISQEAYSILKDDIRSFTKVSRDDSIVQIEEPRESSFMNTILENYYEYALSSIGIQLNRYEAFIENTFKDKKTNLKPDSLEILRSTREEELKSAAYQLLNIKKVSPKTDIIRLRNDFFDYLTNQKNGSTENFYYNSLSNYLSTILEEYTRLPYIRREKIYYRPIFDDFQQAIDEQKQIIITKKGKTHYVLPDAIMPNPLSTYSYLVGFSFKENESKEDMVPCSYRISGIQKEDYRIIKSKSAFLSVKQKELLHNEIAERGVQFLSSEPVNITVKFTSKGIENYYRQINLRPTPKEQECISEAGHPYVFRCSIVQARYYFAQFGANAEIIEPPDLRKDFKKKYHDANTMYTKSLS